MTLDISSDAKKTGIRKFKKRQWRRYKREYFEWNSEPQNPARGEAALWIAVITQAMMDALSRATNAEQRYYKHEALSWLTGNSKDFVMVCHLAGFHPDHIRRSAKRALVSPVRWRAEPGKGKRYQERREYRRKLREQVVQSPVVRVTCDPMMMA